MNFDAKNITTYIGCLALLAFGLYLANQALTFNNNIMEGLTSKSDHKTPEQCIGTCEETKAALVDKLYPGRYKSEYKKMIEETEDILHLKMIEKIKNAAIADKLGDDSVLSSLANLQNIKTGLTDLYEFLDVFKSNE